MTDPVERDPDTDGPDEHRRTFLQVVSGTAAAATGLSATASAQDDDGDGGPETVPLTHGVASGDVTARTAVVWARAAQKATLHVEYSTDESFSDARRERTRVDASTDYTGKVRLADLAPATRYHYRVWATDGGAGQSPESAVPGTFLTPPAPDEDGAVTFAWSGDTWGYGSDPVEPPYEGLRTIADRQPDFFLYHGDTVYADAQTPAGRITEDTPVSESLPIYRGKYKEMRDPPEEVAERTYLRQLLSATSVYTIWDDHEVDNNFAGSIEALMPTGRQAFLEYWPIDESTAVTGAESGRLYRSFRWGRHLELFVIDTRQYRDPNLDLAEKTVLGDEQLAWLKSSLADSDATWKVIASPAPFGHPTDTWASPPDRTGYEAELLALVEHIEAEDISNVVSVAGDVHHSQVGAYDPDHDGEFELYEAIAGPLGAYPGAPDELYPPLNPTEFFAKGDYYNFGTISVEESGETLTIGIYDETGAEQFTKTIQADETNTPGRSGNASGRSGTAPARSGSAPNRSRNAGGGPAARAPERIESTFEEDADGWLVAQNGGSNTPEYYPVGGNPGGHIGDSESRGGIAWYYQAPFKFLGDREPFYGGTLSFDLRQNRTDQQFEAAVADGGDVALTSGGTTLVYEFRGENSKPDTTWTSFEVPLTAEAGWISFVSEEPFATEEEFRAVLADIESLRIRGEYRTGGDESRLDNVVFSRE